jgi:hypothetical protein
MGAGTLGMPHVCLNESPFGLRAHLTMIVEFPFTS